MNQKNHNLYEKFIKLYEVVFKPFFIGGVQKTLNLVKKNKHLNLLEVGCGTGYSFEFYPAGINLTAYDLSQSMVLEARKKADTILENDITVLDSDNYYSYLRSHTYDAVLSFSVITVVPDAQVFLEELRVRCKRGGYIYIVMHQRSKGLGLLIDYLFEWPCRVLFGFTLLRRFDELETQGLEVVETKKINSLLFWRLSDLIVLKKNT